MNREGERLKGLLAGKLDRRDENEIETQLAARPSLRRQLADLALEAEGTHAGPAIRIQPDVATGEPGGDLDVDVGPCSPAVAWPWCVAMTAPRRSSSS